MNNKTKTILGIVIFAVFLNMAVFAYKELSGRFKPEIRLDTAEVPATNETPENTPGSNNPENSPGGTEEEKAPIKAPDFTAYDSEGNIVKLSDYIGKPIVLNFWASWCPPCKSEMPHFDKVYSEVKDEVLFLMVDMVDGAKETEAKGKKYVADNKFSFPVLYDSNQDAAYTYGIWSLPTTVFIDRDGYVAAGVEGAIDEETLLKGISLITERNSR